MNNIIYNLFKLQNEWRCTCTSPTRLHGLDRENLSSYIYVNIPTCCDTTVSSSAVTYALPMMLHILHPGPFSDGHILNPLSFCSWLYKYHMMLSIVNYETIIRICLYRVSQEECEILRERVPYVKLCRYNPKHLYPKLNSYGINGHRKVWDSLVSMNYTPSVTQYSSTAQARQGDIFMQWPWQKVYIPVALTSQDKERSGGLHTVLRSLRRVKTWMRKFL